MRELHTLEHKAECILILNLSSDLYRVGRTWIVKGGNRIPVQVQNLHQRYVRRKNIKAGLNLGIGKSTCVTVPNQLIQVGTQSKSGLFPMQKLH